MSKLETQIDLAIRTLPSKPKHFIVRPARPKGGKARHSGGKHVEWKHTRFGWDALLWDKHGHVLNAINYGLPSPPTPGQKREAERLLLSSVDPRSPLNRRAGGKGRKRGGKARHGYPEETMYYQRHGHGFEAWSYSDGDRVWLLHNKSVDEVRAYAQRHGYRLVAVK